ncbi:MAG: hypothetical protein U1C50_03755 [Patescibacteria group bacterium]|nr:hypothetical protein [Candidatus Beckwithbacteria bacterium]MDZ4229338.1 hypothetical protein [Patescibacteria group bacterium]
MPLANLFGTSGARGLIDQEIDTKFSYKLGLALGKYIKQGKALVARDPRPGAKRLTQALIKGLSQAGIEVEDYGILATPELTWYQVKRGYDLGVVVTGSHLPWNMIGIIPTSAEGAGITSEVGQQITKIFHGL